MGARHLQRFRHKVNFSRRLLNKRVRYNKHDKTVLIKDIELFRRRPQLIMSQAVDSFLKLRPRLREVREQDDGWIFALFDYDFEGCGPDGSVRGTSQ